MRLLHSASQLTGNQVLSVRLKTASNEKTAEILVHGKILTGQEVSRSHQVTETPEKGSIRDNNKKLGQIIYSELFTSFGGLKQRPDLRRRHLAG